MIRKILFTFPHFIACIFLYSTVVLAEKQFTVDPLILHSLGSGKVFIPSDFSLGFEYSPNSSLWFGPEVSLYALADDVGEIGHEEGMKIRSRVIKGESNISFDVNGNAGVANILLKKMGTARRFSSSTGAVRVWGPYVGVLVGPFFRFSTGITLFTAAGTKYYFLPDTIDGIKNRRSGFILDIEASVGFLF